ncbi:hypothetical protein HHK36_032586 [Tetracentron sinense]|uniref:Glutamate decarboxylase n=1 Tax=Tetracentron sinense TaxID=13715 RepID=A0A835CXF6_TETSI|nr:hypothetical protein HHK36_032586 [Tetracentron sinense]
MSKRPYVVPLVAFSFKDNSRHDEFEVADMLRRYGWIVPAYTMPADAQHVTVLRVVIREDFSRTLAERLILDIQKVLHDLDTLPAKLSAKMSAICEETNEKNGNEVVKKTALEAQKEITTAWKKFVMAKKTGGYKNIMENCRENATVLKEGLEKMGRFNIVSKDIGVPLVAFSFKDNSRHDEFEVADMLRRYGWIVPAYTMPADAQHVTVLRVVIREDFSRTLAERLILDIQKVLHDLDTLPAKLSAKMSAICEETNEKNGNEVVKKTALEAQKEITTAWKKFVMAKKTGVC